MGQWWNKMRRGQLWALHGGIIIIGLECLISWITSLFIFPPWQGWGNKVVFNWMWNDITRGQYWGVIRIWLFDHHNSFSESWTSTVHHITSCRNVGFIIPPSPPSPPFFEKRWRTIFYFFSSTRPYLGHFWKKNYFLPLEKCKTLVKICKILAKMPENG